MSSKAVAWTLLVVIAFAAVLLFNYWGALQPLSTLAYSGIVLALGGLANLVIPFRFLGIRKRFVGALVLVSGVALTITALYWPAPAIHVAQHKTQFDDVMPEYQFFERHSVRVHAGREQVMQAIRQSTFGDFKSLDTLLKIRAVASRTPFQDTSDLRSKRFFDSSGPGHILGGNEHEVAMFWGANVRAQRPLEARTLQEFAEYREQGAVKIGLGFNVEDAGDGWSTVTTETRVLATDDNTRRGMGRYWRLIVPGGGLLRRQWLDAIKSRAENMSNTPS